MSTWTTTKPKYEPPPPVGSGKPKSTIETLEAILKSGDDTPVRINPDGSITVGEKKEETPIYIPEWEPPKEPFVPGQAEKKSDKKPRKSKK